MTAPDCSNYSASAGAVESKVKPGVWHLDSYPGLKWRVGGFKDDGQTAKQIQSVTPPTPGTDGVARRWNGHESILSLPEGVYVALGTIHAIEPGPKTVPAAANAQTGHGRQRVVSHSHCNSNGSYANYAATALQDECARVALAHNGTRHDTVRDSSVRFASLAKSLPEVLDWGACREELTAASEKCGLPHNEAQDLIESAWDKAKPRVLPGSQKPASESNGSLEVHPCTEAETVIHGRATETVIHGPTHRKKKPCLTVTQSHV